MQVQDWENWESFEAWGWSLLAWLGVSLLMFLKGIQNFISMFLYAAQIQYLEEKGKVPGLGMKSINCIFPSDLFSIPTHSMTKSRKYFLCSIFFFWDYIFAQCSGEFSCTSALWALTAPWASDCDISPLGASHAISPAQTHHPQQIPVCYLVGAARLTASFLYWFGLLLFSHSAFVVVVVAN